MGALRQAIDRRLRFRLMTAVVAVDQLVTAITHVNPRAPMTSRATAVIIGLGLAVAIGVTVALVR